MDFKLFLIRSNPISNLIFGILPFAAIDMDFMRKINMGMLYAWTLSILIASSSPLDAICVDFRVNLRSACSVRGL